MTRTGLQIPPTRNVRPYSTRRHLLWVSALLVSLVLVLLPWVFKLNGKPHADWQQFLGRFHPLAVHLPIGLLVLLPLLEAAGAVRPALREAAGFVLALTFAACLGTLALGYLLAYGSGDIGPTVTRHMWGGIGLSIVVLLCLLVRPAWASGATAPSSLQRLYPVLLTSALLLLVWTAHQGGSLTHGNNYLTEYMPALVKSVFALGNWRASAPPPGSVYADQIYSIIEHNCVTCHGDGKVEAGLRLNSYEQMMKGGHDGPVILPGMPDQSILIERVTLPADDKHFMPAGRSPLTSQQVALLRAWIAQGASPTAITLAGFALPVARKEKPIQPVGDYSGLMGEIRAMQTGQKAKLVPVSSKPSDGLVLNTIDVAPSFGDQQLVAFEKFAPYIVEAELGHTAITDASFQSLSTFKNLRALHLESTAINGSGLAKLSGLSQLTYLNLSDTKVTAAAVAPLSKMKNIVDLYTFNTPAQKQDAATDTPSTPARTQ